MATGYPFLCQMQQGTWEKDVAIPDLKNGGFHPQLCDIYIPLGAVFSVNTFLHGGGGTKRQFASQLAICRFGQPNWSLLAAWQVVCIFPQGLAVKGVYDPIYNPQSADSRTGAHPDGIPTWDNRYQWSGVDDMGFLEDLSRYIGNRWPRAGRNLLGHSSGGMMAARMWRENPVWFNHYAVCSAPGAGYYLTVPPITPTVLRPFFQQIGYLDDTLNKDGIGPTGMLYADEWIQPAKQFNPCDVTRPGTHMGSWNELQYMVSQAGGGLINQADGVLTIAPGSLGGTELLYSYLNGMFELSILSNALHDVGTHEQCMGTRLVTRWFTWIKSQ